MQYLWFVLFVLTKYSGPRGLGSNLAVERLCRKKDSFGSITRNLRKSSRVGIWEEQHCDLSKALLGLIKGYFFAEMPGAVSSFHVLLPLHP